MGELKWAHAATDLTVALAVAAVAMVLFASVRGRERSSTTLALTLLTALAAAAGVMLAIDALAPPTAQGGAQGVARVALAAVAVMVSLPLIRTIPRAVAFRDRRHVADAARELSESKERFERALEGSSNGLWEWNLETDTVWYAPRFRELLGFDEKDFPNFMASWESAIHPADRKRAMDALTWHLVDETAFDIECRLRTKSGAYRWFAARGVAVRSPDDRPYLMSGSIQDIHDRMQAEEACRRQQEYLAQKHKLEALGEMAGRAAHEFNNLLQAIDGQVHFAQLSLRDGAPAKKDLDLAEGLINQASRFTRELLDVSRRPSGHAEAFSPNDILPRLGAVLRPLLTSSIELRMLPGDDAQYVCGDALALQQAVLNLCINARDAMPHGGVLSVSTGRLCVDDVTALKSDGARPGKYSVVTVADTGSGIGDEVRSVMFEPYFSTKDSGRGVGLGLAIVRSIVSDWGGLVRCDSGLGKGSTFSIWLPAAEESPENHGPGPGKEDNPDAGSEGTILYVEDDDRVRQPWAKLLQREGFRVVVATDGLEAVRLYDTHADDISALLLDVVMPRLDGVQVLEHIRGCDGDTPVVFCTGYAPRPIASRRGELVWIVQKPCKFEQVLATLRKAISARAAREPAAAC